MTIPKKLIAMGTTALMALSIACGGASPTTVPPPVITSFVASSQTITAGQSTTLTANFSGGLGSIDNGVGSVSSGEALTAFPTATTAYTLTVTNSASVSVTRVMTVTVVANATPIILSFTASQSTIASGGSTTLTAVFSGGVGIVDNGVGQIYSGTPVTVAPASTTTYTLTVAGVNSSLVTATTTVAVSTAPEFSIYSYPSAFPITIGGQKAVIVNVTRINGSAGPITLALTDAPVGISGSGIINAGAYSGTRTIRLDSSVAVGSYPLTIQGTDGAVSRTFAAILTATTSATPIITSFDVSPTTITVGQGVTLNAVFSGGTGIVTGQYSGDGVVTSGTVKVDTPIWNNTYTLTVTNGSGEFVRATVGPVFINQTGGVGLWVRANMIITPPSAATGVVTGPDDFSQTFTLQNLNARKIQAAAPGIYTISATPWQIRFPSLGLVMYPIFKNQEVALDANSGTPMVMIQYRPSPCVTADRFSIHSGESTVITAHLSYNMTGIVDNGVGPVASGVPVTVSPTVTTTYTLTSTSQNGTTATSAVTVSVQ